LPNADHQVMNSYCQLITGADSRHPITRQVYFMHFSLGYDELTKHLLLLRSAKCQMSKTFIGGAVGLCTDI